MKKIVLIAMLALTTGMLLSSCKLFKSRKPSCPAYRGAIEIPCTPNKA